MFLDDYWTDMYEPTLTGLRECTRLGYESAWRIHVRPALGHMDIDQLDAAAIDRWLASIPTTGAARKAWALLRTMLRKAHKWGVAQRDVTRQVTPPKPSGYQPRLLDAGQIRQLLQGFWGHELEAWLICSLTLGLRTEEGLGLEWEDIDLRSGRVEIRRGLQWTQGHETLVEPKTELSRRTLILPRFAVLRLRQIKGRGRLIGTLTPGQADRRYRAWCKRNDLPCVPRRNLRHSWATTALAAGVDVAIVSRALGHNSIETTARYYLRPDLDVLKDAQRSWERSIMR